MDETILHLALLFLFQFLSIFFSLLTWALIIWVILSWIVLFRGMRPDNPGFIIFSQLVTPILKPFRWARVGMIDFSVIVAILLIDFVQKQTLNFLIQFLQ